MVSKIHWGGNCILSLGWCLIAQIITGVGKKVTGVVKIHENLDGVGQKVIGVVKIPENLDGIG